ncbi:hypothetical protein BC567DRAFT_250049 [Phyllosticta citribraziliensis]
MANTATTSSCKATSLKATSLKATSLKATLSKSMRLSMRLRMRLRMRLSMHLSMHLSMRLIMRLSMHHRSRQRHANFRPIQQHHTTHLNTFRHSIPMARKDKPRLRLLDPIPTSRKRMVRRRMSRRTRSRFRRSWEAFPDRHLKTASWWWWIRGSSKRIYNRSRPWSRKQILQVAALSPNRTLMEHLPGKAYASVADHKSTDTGHSAQIPVSGRRGWAGSSSSPEYGRRTVELSEYFPSDRAAEFQGPSSQEQRAGNAGENQDNGIQAQDVDNGAGGDHIKREDYLYVCAQLRIQQDRADRAEADLLRSNEQRDDAEHLLFEAECVLAQERVEHEEHLREIWDAKNRQLSEFENVVGKALDVLNRSDQSR